MPIPTMDRLKSMISARKAVVVCGAGVTTAATRGKAPSWEGLIQNGIDRLKQSGKVDDRWVAAQQAQLATGDLSCWLQVADQITAKLDGRFERWLKEVVGDLKLEDRELLDAIGDLDTPVATLNYDGLLYQALKRRPIPWTEANGILRTLHDPNHGIIHLHGYWENPETCVFGTSSYRDATTFAKTQFLQQLMAMNGPLVFIGCGSAGFSDPNLGRLNAWIDENWASAGLEHYWLHREGEETKGLPDHVLPIPYGKAHLDLPKFIRGLVTSTPTAPSTSGPDPAIKIAIDGLPLTPYVTLIGRDATLDQMSEAWRDPAVRVFSLVAEGGTGKTALLNEWLSQQQVKGYSDFEGVLAWSFYSQGSKERAISAEPFLDWACKELGVASLIDSPTSKAEALADLLARKRVLLILDGLEPLQHGPGALCGGLKDSGLATLLRRTAAISEGTGKGLIMITSRLAVLDLKNRQGTSAPVLLLDHLTDDQGATLLRDNGVRGAEADLAKASWEFSGHALSLTLLASFLVECENGDVRRRDHVHGLSEDNDNIGHAHTNRMIESYDSEWLKGEPVLAMVMRIVGLFDRPASADCIKALQVDPVPGLTDVPGLTPARWNRAVRRLRDVRLLLPEDSENSGALDAHPLVRDWFGQVLRKEDPEAWKAAHHRLYDHLISTVPESDWFTLDALTPLYQAVSHGCRAGRYQEALNLLLLRRQNGWSILRHAALQLGAYGANIAVLSWFFEKPFSATHSEIDSLAQRGLLRYAAFHLRALGRLGEASEAYRSLLDIEEATALVDGDDYARHDFAVTADSLSETCLFAGPLADAVRFAEIAQRWAEKEHYIFKTSLAAALSARGKYEQATKLFEEAEAEMTETEGLPVLYSLAGYQYCDHLMKLGKFSEAQERFKKLIDIKTARDPRLDDGLEYLIRARAEHGLALACQRDGVAHQATSELIDHMFRSVDLLRNAGQIQFSVLGLLHRSALYISVGDWAAASADLDEAQECSEGEMPVMLAEQHLKRVRLYLCMANDVAPLRKGPAQKIQNLGPAEMAEAAKSHLAAAKKLVQTTGFDARRQDLKDLQDVIAGRKAYAEIPHPA